MVYLSIIIPVYNGEKYIKKAIESCLSSTDEKYEIIIVNDGSKDKTEQYIKEMDDVRIKYIYQENKGPSTARNTGLKIARGKFVTFLDADDVFENGAIGKLIGYAKENVGTIIFNKRDRYHEKIENNQPLFLKENIDKEEIMDKLLCTDLLNVVWGKLYKRDILMEKEIFFSDDICMGEDLIFNLNYFKNVNHDIKYDNNSILIQDKCNVGSIVNTYKQRYFFDMEKCYETRMNFVYDQYMLCDSKERIVNIIRRNYFLNFTSLIFKGVECENRKEIDRILCNNFANEILRMENIKYGIVRYLLVKGRMYRAIHLINIIRGKKYI